jgi:hypothetical protein
MNVHIENVDVTPAAVESEFPCDGLPCNMVQCFYSNRGSADWRQTDNSGSVFALRSMGKVAPLLHPKCIGRGSWGSSIGRPNPIIDPVRAVPSRQVSIGHSSKQARRGVPDAPGPKARRPRLPVPRSLNRLESPNSCKCVLIRHPTVVEYNSQSASCQPAISTPCRGPS